MTWTWWMTLLVIFAVLVLIGCIPVGVDARYSADGVFLTAKLGPFLLQLLPQKPKKKPKKRKPQQKLQWNTACVSLKFTSRAPAQVVNLQSARSSPQDSKST